MRTDYSGNNPGTAEVTVLVFYIVMVGFFINNVFGTVAPPDLL
jgi:hypothetical protein